MYQSIPSVTTTPPGNPAINFQNLANPSDPGKFFCQMLSPQTSLGIFTLINFTLFHRIVYKFLWKTDIHQLKICENHKSLK